MRHNNDPTRARRPGRAAAVAVLSATLLSGCVGGSSADGIVWERAQPTTTADPYAAIDTTGLGRELCGTHYPTIKTTLFPHEVQRLLHGEPIANVDDPQPSLPGDRPLAEVLAMAKEVEVMDITVLPDRGANSSSVIDEWDRQRGKWEGEVAAALSAGTGPNVPISMTLVGPTAAGTQYPVEIGTGTLAVIALTPPANC